MTAFKHLVINPCDPNALLALLRGSLPVWNTPLIIQRLRAIEPASLRWAGRTIQVRRDGCNARRTTTIVACSRNVVLQNNVRSFQEHALWYSRLAIDPESHAVLVDTQPDAQRIPAAANLSAALQKPALEGEHGIGLLCNLRATKAARALISVRALCALC